jgi:hypothetical protein
MVRGVNDASYYVGPMIEIDDKKLTKDERDFLQRWAEALGVPIAELVIRILSGAVDGDQYIAKRPRD